MPKKNKLKKALEGKNRDLKAIQSKTEQEMKEVLNLDQEGVGLKYRRSNFYISYADDDFIEDLVLKLKRRTGLKISKSLLVEYSLKLLKDCDETKLLEDIEQAARKRAIDLLQ